MVWYEMLDRSRPYVKNHRGWNLWYNYNNGKHYEMHRMKYVYFDHWLRRFTKTEGAFRFVGAYLFLPFLFWAYKTYKRFGIPPKEEESLYSEVQQVANLSRNPYGFETRAAKSFEHMLGILLGKEIMGHILSQDSDIFRQEELGDEDEGLVGDFTEEDVLHLRKQVGHSPHVGIVFFEPDRHYLNEKPNDFLSPYKVVGEKEQTKSSSHH